MGDFGFIVPSVSPPAPQGLFTVLSMKDSSTKMVSSTWFSLASILGGHGGEDAVPSARPRPRARCSLVDVAFEGLQLLALGGRDHLLDLLQLRGLGARGLHGGQDGFHALRLLQQPPGHGDKDTAASACPHNPPPAP